MSKRSVYSLMMASVMTAGLLAGCSGGNNTKDTAESSNKPAETAAATNQAEGAYPDYSKGFGKKSRLTFRSMSVPMKAGTCPITTIPAGYRRSSATNII